MSIDSSSFAYAVIAFLVCIIIEGAYWGGGAWYYSSTEAGKRDLKTQESNLNGGIKRQVLVYDMDGDLLEEFQGHFDVDYETERILFDDENGFRHIIYFKSGTIIVNEIE